MNRAVYRRRRRQRLCRLSSSNPDHSPIILIVVMPEALALRRLIAAIPAIGQRWTATMTVSPANPIEGAELFFLSHRER